MVQRSPNVCVCVGGWAFQCHTDVVLQRCNTARAICGLGLHLYFAGPVQLSATCYLYPICVRHGEEGRGNHAHASVVQLLCVSQQRTLRCCQPCTK